MFFSKLFAIASVALAAVPGIQAIVVSPEHQIHPRQVDEVTTTTTSTGHATITSTVEAFSRTVVRSTITRPGRTTTVTQTALPSASQTDSTVTRTRTVVSPSIFIVTQYRTETITIPRRFI
ncbi:hypothetical protein BD310DRAFT_353342 [Dichomitus squalens]|uniref:Uncharacterized protein n=1 Tax=Dichomitus squalens TaxID=114155 RepID=A0A4Q9P9S4_9APHY|nr:hypothetical protein BD310DRAFT_353342 [Dichomitus squalens]